MIIVILPEDGAIAFTTSGQPGPPPQLRPVPQALVLLIHGKMPGLTHQDCHHEVFKSQPFRFSGRDRRQLR